MNQPAVKTPVLGTAQWGWTVDQPTAFQILDFWLEAGFNAVDVATNYPLNRNPPDFRAAEKMLAQYCAAPDALPLRITMKIGALDNMRGPTPNLSPSFIRMMGIEYRRIFGDHLDCIMLHWDNRDDESDIRGSLEALVDLQRDWGIRPGLSGIAHPDVYARACDGLDLAFDIQLKHNVLQSDLSRYRPLMNGKNRFFAYGLNAGGVKLDAQYSDHSTFLSRGGDAAKYADRIKWLESRLPDWNTAFVRPPLKTMNQIGLLNAVYNTDLQGIILGVSSVMQLTGSLDFYKDLLTFDYQDVFSDLSLKLLD